MAEPLISVIICTHNRDSYLGLAIASALGQDFGGFEVIVVDNASTDSTRTVVESFDDSRLIYLYEPVLGLSVARNRGATEAQGEILLYLDDDAKAGSGWLASIHQAFADPQVAIAGGQSTLIWPKDQPPPPWLSTNLTGSLGRYDLGS
ncbi:glycosyltransferase, partial [filamentous cyanobacterium CCP5]